MKFRWKKKFFLVQKVEISLKKKKKNYFGQKSLNFVEKKKIFFWSKKEKKKLLFFVHINWNFVEKNFFLVKKFEISLKISSNFVEKLFFLFDSKKLKYGWKNNLFFVLKSWNFVKTKLFFLVQKSSKFANFVEKKK